jgi:hypothetical protein
MCERVAYDGLFIMNRWVRWYHFCTEFSGSHRLLILRLFEFRYIPLPVHEPEWYLLFFTAMNEEDAAPVHSRKKQYFKLGKDFEFPPEIHHKLRTI